METKTVKLDQTELRLGRVTVLLGANGAGKSSLLRKARDRVTEIVPRGKALYVEGGRAITLQKSLQLTVQNVNQYQDYTHAKQTYENKLQTGLSARVYDALMMLERKELALKADHSDAVQRWHVAGEVGACPRRDIPPLEKLSSQFHELFPKLTVRYDATSKRLYARKGDAEYSIVSLSDGEKQVFSILADFVELGRDYGFVVVDEPELNLHPELAERLWNLIEAEYPETVFLYATHSLGFAMRPGVSQVVILGEEGESTVSIDSAEDFSRVELHDFLGSIPGIIAAKRVVVTEGNDKSFDALFYRWLLGDDQVEIMPAGGCDQVINVCRRDGIWSKIARTVSLVGVVDRDFGKNPISEYVVLPFREAESYLAIPALAVLADSKLGITETRLTHDAVVNTIMKALKDEYQLICASVVAARCGIRLGVSITRAVLRECASTEDLMCQLRQSSQAELAKAAAALGDDAIERTIRETAAELDRIRKELDWASALAFVDGKRIANDIAHLMGVRNSIDLMRSVSSNLASSSTLETTWLISEFARRLVGTAPLTS